MTNQISTVAKQYFYTRIKIRVALFYLLSRMVGPTIRIVI